MQTEHVSRRRGARPSCSRGQVLWRSGGSPANTLPTQQAPRQAPLPGKGKAQAQGAPRNPRATCWGSAPCHSMDTVAETHTPHPTLRTRGNAAAAVNVPLSRRNTSTSGESVHTTHHTTPLAASSAARAPTARHQCPRHTHSARYARYALTAMEAHTKMRTPAASILSLDFRSRLEPDLRRLQGSGLGGPGPGPGPGAWALGPARRLARARHNLRHISALAVIFGRFRKPVAARLRGVGAGAECQSKQSGNAPPPPT